jgi:microcystin-dependent protein
MTVTNLIGNELYPVGSIYMSLVDVPPPVGTWQRIAEGKTLVGVDTADTDFATPNKTGGEKKHTLAISEMPAHDHPGTALGYIDSKAQRIGVYNGTGGSGWSAGGQATYGGYYTVNAQGGGAAHNNIPPYLTCYIWKRTG